jgi:protein-disulfide isomerase
MPLLEQVLEQYPDQVKLVFKNLPLRNHRYARKAAAASLAAYKQGKFWEFNKELFKAAGKLTDQKIRQITAQLGLNQEQFQKDWGDPHISEKIDKDIKDAMRIGVKGTPSIYVNGRLLGQRSMEGFRLIIEKELKKNGKGDG